MPFDDKRLHLYSPFRICFRLMYWTNFYPSVNPRGRPHHPGFSQPAQTESFLLPGELLLNITPLSITDLDVAVLTTCSHVCLKLDFQ